MDTEGKGLDVSEAVKMVGRGLGNSGGAKSEMEDFGTACGNATRETKDN